MYSLIHLAEIGLAGRAGILLVEVPVARFGEHKSVVVVRGIKPVRE
jgi:hypothetical protein